MLVLSRKLRESIVIAWSVRVTILEARGNRVRLGIEAPPEVRVDRAEVTEARRSVIVRRNRFMVEHAPVGVLD